MQRYAKHYQRSQVMTASPGQLLLLAYDGAIRFLREAGAAMAKRDLASQSDAIVRAQSILLYLLQSLNHDADAALADNLDRIYRYLYDRLTRANVDDDLQGIEEALGMLGSLRGAWEEAEGQVRGAAPAAVGAS